MSFNGSGVFSIINTFVYDTVISETEVNANFSDIATGLSTCITKDGQTTVTANIPMATYKFTGLGAGSAAADSANLGQIQAQAYIWCGTAGGTADAITLSPSPAITAYAAGQTFRWKAGSSANTGAMTVAISGLTTIAAQSDLTALSAGDHEANAIYEGVLDTTSTIQIKKVALAPASTFSSSDITGQTSATAATGDSFVFTDADDSDNLKKDTIQGILDLLSAASNGGAALSSNAISVDPNNATDTAIAAGDEILFADVNDSNNVKKDTVQGILDLVPSSGITLGTEQASTSGTSIDFTGIPSGTKRIIITFQGVSTNGTDLRLVQLGDSGGIETTGYVASGTRLSGGGAGLTTTSTAGFIFGNADAASAMSGHMILTLSDAANFTWISSHSMKNGTALSLLGGGDKSLSAELDRVRITTTGGSNTFDAGAINIQYEG